MPDYEILFNCFILCGTALRPKCYQSSDEMAFVPGICLCSIFHFSRQQWCIQNSSTDASSFHLYPQTFQRSFYLASILVICFYFPYKLAQLKVHHGTGGKEQKLEWKTKKHKLKDTGEHGMKTHGAERQEVEGKGAERQKEKDHNAKGQRTEDIVSVWLRGRPDCFVMPDCSAGSDGSRWPCIILLTGPPSSYFRGQVVTRGAWHILLDLDNLNDTPWEKNNTNKL